MSQGGKWWQVQKRCIEIYWAFWDKSKNAPCMKGIGDDLSNWPQEMGLRWSTYFLQPIFQSMHSHMVGTNIWAVSWHLPWCYFMSLWLAGTSPYIHIYSNYLLPQTWGQGVWICCSTSLRASVVKLLLPVLVPSLCSCCEVCFPRETIRESGAWNKQTVASSWCEIFSAVIGAL